MKMWERPNERFDGALQLYLCCAREGVVPRHAELRVSVHISQHLQPDLEIKITHGVVRPLLYLC